MGFPFGGQIDPKKYPNLARTAGIGQQEKSAPSNPYGYTPASKGGGFGGGMKWDQGAWDQGMGDIRRRATGQESVARQQSGAAVEQAQSAIASQLASGGYNPAVYRSGHQAMSEVGQQVAAETAIAAARERAQAQNMYMGLMNQYLQAGLSRDQAASQASIAIQNMRQQAQQAQLNRQHQQGMLGQQQQYDWLTRLTGMALGRRRGRSEAKAVTSGGSAPAPKGS